MRSSYKIIAVFLTAILLAALALTLAGCGGGSVTVPNVKRLSVAEAKKVLGENNLKAKVASELLDDQVPKGYVVTQNPRPGDEAQRDSVVLLAVSAGSSGVTVPSVLGKDVDQAKSELNALGLQAVVTKVQSVEPSGTVIGQSPGAGATVVADSKIALTVSANFDKATPGGTSAVPAPATPPAKQTGYVVVIDPGHQARGNPEGEPNAPGSSVMKPKVAGGADGVATGKPEYLLTLAISTKLRSYLVGKGVKVVMTRMSNDVDVSNIERAQIANRASADLFVRIHANSSDNSSVEGIQTFYPPNGGSTTPIYAKSSLAATVVQQRVAASSHQKSLPTRELADQTGFNWAKVPTILVETGYLSNPAEDRFLWNPSSQQAIAKGIGQGIVEYLKRAK